MVNIQVTEDETTKAAVLEAYADVGPGTKLLVATLTVPKEQIEGTIEDLMAMIGGRDAL